MAVVGRCGATSAPSEQQCIPSNRGEGRGFLRPTTRCMWSNTCLSPKLTAIFTDLLACLLRTSLASVEALLPTASMHAWRLLVCESLLFLAGHHRD